MSATLDWFGCATFRLSIDNVTIFLDAYIDRVPSAPGSGMSADDIRKCDFIVIGHSHFDHLYGAERIAKNTGATVIANYETARLLEALGVNSSQIICVSGGERIGLAPGIVVNVLPSLHSCTWTGTHQAGSDETCLGDLDVLHREREARGAAVNESFARTLSQEAIEHLLLASHTHSPNGDGGALLFLFETPEGTLLFQDTAGSWSRLLSALRPDVAILAAVGRGNVDGEPVQGSLATFIADEAKSLGSPRVILSHHDDWLPGFAGAPDIGPIRSALEALEPPVELLELGYVDSSKLFASS